MQLPRLFMEVICTTRCGGDWRLERPGWKEEGAQPHFLLSAEPHREGSILSRHLVPLRLSRHPAPQEEKTQVRKNPFLLRQLQKDKDLELTGASYLLEEAGL